MRVGTGLPTGFAFSARTPRLSGHRTFSTIEESEITDRRFKLNACGLNTIIGSTSGRGLGSAAAMRDEGVECPSPQFADIVLVADLIEQIGAPDFYEQLSRRINKIIPCAFSVIYLYRPNAAPAQLFCDRVPEKNLRGFQNYLDVTYVINPVYRAFKNGIASGVYRMQEITPDGYFDTMRERADKIKPDIGETIGFLTLGWPSHMEELLLLIELGDGNLVEISVSRKLETGFCDADIGLAKRVFPILASCFRRHWQLRAGSIEPLLEEARLDRALHDFAADTLSPREQDVVQYILMGHSTYSISSHLGTSIPTVKTHRKNAYRKLMIATQAELFAQFVAFIFSRQQD